MSDRNPLDDIPSYPPLATVVEPRGTWVGVAGQVLHVFQRYTLGEQVGDRGSSERMRRKTAGQPGVTHAAFDHAANVIRGHAEIR